MEDILKSVDIGNKRILVVETGQIFKTKRDCAMLANISPQYIKDMLTGKKTHYKNLSIKLID